MSLRLNEKSRVKEDYLNFSHIVLDDAYINQITKPIWVSKLNEVELGEVSIFFDIDQALKRLKVE